MVSYPCSICGKQYPTKSIMLEHQLNEHSKVEEKKEKAPESSKKAYSWQERRANMIMRQIEMQDMRNEVIRGMIQERTLLKTLANPDAPADAEQVDIEQIKSEIEGRLRAEADERERIYDEAYKEAKEDLRDSDGDSEQDILAKIGNKIVDNLPLGKDANTSEISPETPKVDIILPQKEEVKK